MYVSCHTAPTGRRLFSAVSPRRLAVLIFVLAVAPTARIQAQSTPDQAADPGRETEAAKAKEPFPRIFDGKSLDGWRTIDVFDFQDHGKVYVDQGVIHLERGKPATGISWKGEFPRSNYEVTLRGKRVAGNDFFCGLTFPVKDEHCTLILGGWGGQVVGLSNIDGYSAVENETTQAISFQQDRWYKIRLQVTDDAINAWIDGKRMIGVETQDRKFSLYWEQEPVRPLGIVTWRTHGAIKDLRVRPVQ